MAASGAAAFAALALLWWPGAASAVAGGWVVVEGVGCAEHTAAVGAALAERHQKYACDLLCEWCIVSLAGGSRVPLGEPCRLALAC